MNKPHFLLLPPDDPGAATEFAEPTENINTTLENLASLDPSRRLAVILIEDPDGDDRLAISWVDTE